MRIVAPTAFAPYPRRFWIGSLMLGVFGCLALFADFHSAASPGEQFRTFPNTPPARLQFTDAQGHWHWWPHVTTANASVEPLQIWVRSEPYRWLGLVSCKHRLFGTTAPTPLFWLGTDGLGRDVWARLWHGARLSLALAIIAILLAVPLALLVGGVAGYYGGVLDFGLMRLLELLLALPALYFVIALRSALPLDLTPAQIFAALAVVIGWFGWAHLARIVRGLTLSLREREFVYAAKALGASDARILLRHILPQLSDTIFTQAALAAPSYILAEVTLSYLGLGIPEPMPSWGNMLAATQSIATLARHWWNLAPLVALILTSLAFQLIADGLRKHSATSTETPPSPMV